MARRPRQIAPRSSLSAAQIAGARYVGSAEHKTKRWWGGLPAAFEGAGGRATRPKKQVTTVCPLNTAHQRDAATEWVRAALTAGQYLYLEGDKDFPARIWYREPTTGQVWFGYRVTDVLGQYKGWPIDEEQRRAVFG